MFSRGISVHTLSTPRSVHVLLKRHRATSHRACDDEYQRLAGSELATDVFQQSLPRLPIPTIENTCRRYLSAQRPLLIDHQLDATRQSTLLFQQGEGRQLQDLLRARDKANRHTSYISEPWSRMYLEDRRPLVLNYNPFLSFIDDPDDGQMEQTVRAANMVVSALRFRRALLDNTLAPEVFHLNAAKSDTAAMRRLARLLPRSLAAFGAYWYKAFPLDMSQFSSLFASTRVPATGCDRLERFADSRHILVLCRGQMYAVDVLDSSGLIRPARDIHASLRQITTDQRSFNKDTALGYLTAEDRDLWASERQHLLQLGNAELLGLIDSALFVLALDSASSGDDQRAAFRQFLHGDAANRWYDKSFTLIVAGDGRAAINFEHAWGDGVAVLRFFNEVHKDSSAGRFVTPASEVGGEASVRRLDQWNLDSRARAAVEQANKRFQQLTASFDVGQVYCQLMGKELCKQRRVSPDALMQMAFQVAYHRLTGGVTASYESCSTSAFRHGRTETIRPATEATVELSRAMNGVGSPPPATRLLQLVRQCSRVHGELTVNAAKGQGCDRHLFALRKLAEETTPSRVHEIFADPAYAAFNRFRISTSTLSSPAATAGGFGAVERDGFGIGYMIRDSELGALVSAYPEHTDLTGFVDCLNSTFKELHQILSAAE